MAWSNLVAICLIIYEKEKEVTDDDIRYVMRIASLTNFARWNKYLHTHNQNLKSWQYDSPGQYEQQTFNMSNNDDQLLYLPINTII